MERKVSLYTMLLGNTGIVKVGQCYSDRLRERLTEHGRRFGVNRKDIVILSDIPFASRKTAEDMESKLIKACENAGLTMVLDPQDDRTERFYINPTITEVSVKARKLVYNVKVC